MKAAIATIYQVPNYGSVLQAFATQEIIRSLIGECYIINYKYPNEWHYRQGLRKDKLNLKKIIGRIIGLTPYYRRLKKLDTFRSNNLCLTRLYESFDELNADGFKDYNLLIAGSDQIWNTKYQKGDPFFTLSFAADGIRRISIASSFAQKSLDKKFEQHYKAELSKFAALSVRETNGIGIINAQLGIEKNVAHLLDPTLLLSKKEWMNVIHRSKFKKKRKYILWYVLSYAFKPKPYICDVAKWFREKFGECDVIALEGYCKDLDSENFKMRNMEDSSISQFIDLFANADLVITSSFHGTAFATNFGKPLISVVPDNDGDDRQVSLLNSLGLQGCIARIGAPIENIMPYYDAEITEKQLNVIRENNIAWIRNNIK